MELTNTENIRPPLSVLRCKVEAGVAPSAALMQCRREAHFISVQAGGVTVYMNGEAYVLGTGDSLLVDPYVPHRALPSPETGVDYLSLFLDVSALYSWERHQSSTMEPASAKYPISRFSVRTNEGLIFSKTGKTSLRMRLRL